MIALKGFAARSASLGQWRVGRLATAIALLLASLLMVPSQAGAQEACGFYRVKRGDDLHKISMEAYGFNNFRAIYRANAANIGRPATGGRISSMRTNH